MGKTDRGLPTLKAGLLEFVANAGMRALRSLLERERTEICGERHARPEMRRAWRFGYADGELILGGRRVRIRRPRVRSVDGEEISLPSWEGFRAEDPLGRRALEQMMIGVSTRRYGRSLEDLPVTERGTTRSAVSRRFVALTTEEMRATLERDLSGLDLVAIMIDGVHFAENVILVALGIDAGGYKHVLGLQQGATENTVACRALLTDLAERGVRTDCAMLFVLDGSRALTRAVREVFGALAMIQRCQVHKARNVAAFAPLKLRESVAERLSRAYRSDVTRAKADLLALATELERKYPAAAKSLREGLNETLTVTQMELPDALERTLVTTNPIESLVGQARWISRNVKRWRDGSMILRWMVAATNEAATGFRRVNGHRGIERLRRALKAHEATVRSFDEVPRAA